MAGAVAAVAVVAVVAVEELVVPAILSNVFASAPTRSYPERRYAGPNAI